MEEQIYEFLQKAKTIPIRTRKDIIRSFKETDLHVYFKRLFEAMESDYHVEITHGTRELGKDLVMVQKDSITINVIGVLVKRGKITGKTLGEVDGLKNRIKDAFSEKFSKKMDEIESQVQQAIEHPADIKEIFRSLAISKLIIIVTGEFSNTAKERIRKEIDNTTNIEIKDIKWLVDNFTIYYPQIFFDKDVIDYIQKEINLLEAESMFSKRGKLLSECFIEPWVSTIVIPKEINEDALKKISNIKSVPFFSLKSTLKSNRNILLIGEPGSGKSSSLAKLEIDYLKGINYKNNEASNIKIEIPLLLTIAEFEKVNDVELLIEMKFPLELRNRAKINLLMIDGLDESEPVNRKNILEKAKSFAKRLNCALIISSRKIDIVEESLLDFQKYELLSFRLNQAFTFFKKIVKDVKVLQELKKGLQKIHFKIPLNPLTLLFLVELVEINKEVPASITELYDRFLDIALGRFDFEKGIKVLFDYYRKKNFLSEFAFIEFFKKNRLEVSTDDFNIFLEGYIEKYGIPKNKLDNFIDELKRSGVLKIGKNVMFCHRSCLDFSIAFYLKEQSNEIKNIDSLLIKIYFDDIWTSVTFFYIGLNKKISKDVLEKLINFKDEKHDELKLLIKKYMIAGLLQAGWHSPYKTMVCGVKDSLRNGPLIREKLVLLTEVHRDSIPIFIIDTMLMILSEVSFGSAFLLKAINEVQNELLDHPSKENLYMVISLFWSIKRFLDDKSSKNTTDEILQKYNELKDISILDNASALWLLRVINHENKDTMKYIDKKIDKLIKKFPKAIKGFFPKKRKGFRNN
jgi:hypothetical protein